MATLKSKSQLKAAGGFVAPEPIKREVVWERTDEEGQEKTDTFDIYIVRVNLGTMLAANKAPEGAEPVAYELSRYLMLDNDKGKPELITYEEACCLEPTLAAAILKVVKEARTPKNSTLPTNSSAILSPAESAAAP